MRLARATLPFALAASLLLLLPALAAAPPADPLDAALRYLISKRDDGKAHPFGVQSPYVVEALAHVGIDPKTWPTPETNVYATMRPYTSPDTGNDYYSYTRIAFAAGIAGYDPRDVDGVDYVERVRAGFTFNQFGNVTYNNDDVWAILALRAAGVPAHDPQVQTAVQNVQRARAADGGWSHLVASLHGDVDSTGMVLTALEMAGIDLRNDPALAFLDSLRTEKGGYRADRTVASPSTQSTAWALHALAAMRQPIPEDSVRFILDHQDEATGGFRNGDAKTATPSPFTTVEALATLSARHAHFPSYQSPHVSAPEHATAGAPATFTVGPPFTSAHWTFGGSTLEGTDVHVAFDTPGSYAWSVYAEGPGIVARHHGTVDVVTERPTLHLARALPETALRHETLTLDARGSSPGVLRVDWDDGNVTENADRLASHAYTHPGPRTVRATLVAPDGVPSETATALVRILNRAPTIADVPERVQAHRGRALTLALDAHDPDGDPVEVLWTFQGVTATGVWNATPRTLGDHEATVLAQDPYGATSTARILVHVANVEPTLTDLALPSHAHAHEPIAYAVAANDPDGERVDVAWTFGTTPREGMQGTITLDEGTYAVRVTATDADGATTTLTRTLRIVAANEPLPDARDEEPRVENVTATLHDGTLHVAFHATPKDAPRTVRWESDAGDGETTTTQDTLALPLPGATRARVTVEVHLGDALARAESAVARATSSAAHPRLRLEALASEARVGERVDVLASAQDGAWLVLDFGDGNTTSGTSPLRTFHRYATPGEHRITLHGTSPRGPEEAAADVVVHPAPPEAAPQLAPPETPVVHVAAHTPPPAAAPEPEAATEEAHAPLPRQETPGITPWSMLAAALAGAAMRRRRAPSR